MNDIAEVFSLLHDGTVIKWAGDKDLLTLKISCLYLAERIKPTYEYFYLDLHKINKLEFNPWTAPSDIPNIIKQEPGEIFETELEVLYAEVKDDSVKVSFNQADPKYDYCGGNLYVNCDAIKLFDHEHKELAIGQLNQICNEYWDDWKIKNK